MGGVGATHIKGKVIENYAEVSSPLPDKQDPYPEVPCLTVRRKGQAGPYYSNKVLPHPKNGVKGV